VGRFFVRDLPPPPFIGPKASHPAFFMAPPAIRTLLDPTSAPLVRVGYTKCFCIFDLLWGAVSPISQLWVLFPSLFGRTRIPMTRPHYRTTRHSVSRSTFGFFPFFDQHSLAVTSPSNLFSSLLLILLRADEVIKESSYLTHSTFSPVDFPSMPCLIRLPLHPPVQNRTELVHLCVVPRFLISGTRGCPPLLKDFFLPVRVEFQQVSS